MSSDRCPCRKITEAVVYAECCGRYHAGAVAPSAEALMRSRFAAFALGDHAYLLATWHISKRPAALEGHDAWTMLKIHAAHESGDVATVRFTARWRRAGRTGVLDETSRFIREGGRWFYLDATEI